jgi:putative ABC transport system permease protein
MLQRQNRNDAYVIGRLKPDVSIAQAQAQFATIGQRIALAYPEGNDGVRPVLVPLRDHLARGAQAQQLLLLGAVAMLLLITCVNVANLLLARAASRDREMAVRTAIGASRWQIIRQLLTESLLLALGGGALGCLLGAWGNDFAQRLIPWELQPIAGDAGFDGRVLLFVLGVTVLTGVGFGLAPAWRLSHADPNDALKNTPRLVNTWLGRFRLANALVVAQVALALMLLIGAGLMIRSLQRLTAVNPGFQPAQVLTVQPAPPSMQEFSHDPLATTRYYEAMLENVLRLPAVQSAGFIAGLPFTSAQAGANFFRTDRPLPSGTGFPFTHTHTVTTDYFRTMGIPLLRGRLLSGREPIPALQTGVGLTPENNAKAVRAIVLEVVISQRMAELYWPDEDPLGKRFQLGFPEMNLPVAEIVGVVGNTTQNGLDQAPPSEAYLSIRQFPTPMPMHLVLRSSLDLGALAPLVRTAIAEVAKDKPILDLKPMTARIDESVDRRRFNLTLFAFFAGCALLLAALGLYGVLGFVVSRRTRELGLRMALGAQRGHVLGNVLWRGFALVLLGSGIGLGGAWALSRLIESQLFGTARTDPFTYAAAAALLLLVALVACVIPARRATRINPIEALRAD